MSVMVLLQSADMINQREMAIDKGNHSSHDDCRNHRSRAQPLQMVKEEQENRADVRISVTSKHTFTFPKSFFPA